MLYATSFRLQVLILAKFGSNIQDCKVSGLRQNDAIFGLRFVFKRFGPGNGGVVGLELGSVIERF